MSQLVRFGYRLFACGALGLLAVQSASAGVVPYIQQYNLITIDDAYTGSHVDYNAFIGGNLRETNGGATFAMHSFTQPGAGSNIGLTVANDVYAQNKESFKVTNGKTAVVGGVYRNLTSGLEQPDSVQYIGASSVTLRADLGTLRQDIINELTTASAGYASLDAGTSSVYRDPARSNYLVFDAAPNAAGVAVFNIAAAVLEDSTIASITLKANGATQFVVNVTGTGTGGTFDFGGRSFVDGWLLDDTRAKTIWNFVDATQLNIDSNWYGAILATKADVKNSSNIDGSVFAKTIHQNAEIHKPFFSGFVPPLTTTPAVPEPSTLALGTLGLAGMALATWRKRQARARDAA